MGKARSIKVAGPQPRTVPKKPVKVCAAGHVQHPIWKDACVRCEQEEERRLQGMGVTAEREEWRRRLGPFPDVLTMRVESTGQLLRFAIPRGARRRRR